jgi:predicted glutamine amidotransferase
MCELLALSASHDVDVAVSFAELARHGGDTDHSADGWGGGGAYYEGQDAVILRDPHAASHSPWAKCLVDFPFQSQTVIAHIRRATQGDVSLRNTQPFQREFQGRVHVFAHNRNLHHVVQATSDTGRFRPIGTTASEGALCLFLNQLDADTKGSAALAFDVLCKRFIDFSRQMAAIGPANMIYSDGAHIFAHADRRIQKSGDVAPPGLFLLERHCPPGFFHPDTKGIAVSGDSASVILLASVPLSRENWRALPKGTVLAIANGRLMLQQLV